MKGQKKSNKQNKNNNIIYLNNQVKTPIEMLIKITFFI